MFGAAQKPVHYLTAHYHTAVTVFHITIFNHNVFAGNVDPSSVAVPARFDGDAIVASVEFAIGDVYVF